MAKLAKGKASRARKMAPTALSHDELEVICQKLGGIALSESLYERHSLAKGPHDAEVIQSCLMTCASSAFCTKPREAAERKSRDEVAKRLGALLNVLARQRKQRIDDPAREGLELFVMYAQRGEAPEGLLDWPDLELMRPQQHPKPAVLPLDRFRSVGSHWTIENDIGWLELLLRGIHTRLAVKPSGRLGPKGKRDVRDYFIWKMARFYESSGGSVKAYNNPATGKVESRFISFLSEIVALCPEPLEGYLATGLADAVLDWDRRGRPPSHRIIELRLF